MKDIRICITAGRPLKRLLLIVFVIIFQLFAVSCSDDFAPYEEKSHDISKAVSGNIYVVSQIEPQISAIAAEYSDKAKLYYAEYTFNDKDSGEVLFAYKNNYTKGSTGYTELVDVYVDMQSKTAVKVEYTNGHAKRVSGYGSAYIGSKNTDARELYLKHISKATEQADVKKLTITYSNDEVLINCYDSDGRQVYHDKLAQ